MPWLQGRCGNPSSVHSPGRAARTAIEAAREQVAQLANAHTDQVIFTSGGTESNNLALKGIAGAMQKGRMAVSSIEHPSVLGPARALERHGWRLDLIEADEDGRVSLDSVGCRVEKDTRLISVMWANNETGVTQDIAGIVDIARQSGTLVHSDAVQAAGKLPLDFAASGIHLMSLSAHKMNGPLGVGALVMDRSLEIDVLFQGGGQEKGLRAGTENVAGIVGFGRAAELAKQDLEVRHAHMQRLREGLEVGLRRFPGVRVIAEKVARLPNTTLLIVPGIDGETMLMNLDRVGIAISSGSACASGGGEPSHVLLAMGIDPAEARRAIRISLGTRNTRQDVEAVLAALAKQLDILEAMAISMDV